MNTELFDDVINCGEKAGKHKAIGEVANFLSDYFNATGKTEISIQALLNELKIIGGAN